MENIEILGKKWSDKERKDAKDFIGYEQQRASDPVNGEYQKIEDDNRIISTLNNYLQEELEVLGLEGIDDINPNQIHLYPSATYKQKFPKVDATAFHEAFDKVINIDADEVDVIGRLQFFKGLLHEMVHVASKSKYYLKADKSLKATRSGYHIANPIKEHEHLKGLNEAVVEKTTRDIFDKHRLEIIRDFDISLEDYSKEAKYLDYYDLYIEVLEIIVKRVADTNREKEDEVWNRFKRGIFTGEMIHLKDVEKAYGKGALRVLDILESDKMYVAPEETIEWVKNYFLSR